MVVTALVVNWSTPEDLRQCVASGLGHELGLTFAIYQNHHPTIDSTGVLKDLSSGYKVVYEASPYNEGHGRGTNQAAKLATKMWDPEYFFIVNPDVMWVEPVLDRMIDFLEEDPARVVVGPKQMDSNYRVTAGGIIGDGRSPKHRYWHHRDPKNTLGRDAVQGPTVAGSAMLVRADDFLMYGGLLESKHYYSETWFCYHARAHGRECWYYGEPWMIHEWHRSSPLGAAGTDGAMSEDRKLFRKMCDEHDPPIPHD